LLSLNCHIYNDKIENIKRFYPSVITCRAFSSIEKILSTSERFITKDAVIVLLKGENYQGEIKEAHDIGWIFEYNISKSITENKAVVLKLTNVRRK
jgi:16S rRNA G527 N7-methylase RsmG